MPYTSRELKEHGFYRGDLDPIFATDSPELFLATLQDSECNCWLCKDACKTAPCWGTPQEIEKLMNEGYGKKLTDYIIEPGHYGLPITRIRRKFPDIHVISPGEGYAVGLSRGSSSTGITFRGRCVFFKGRGKNEICLLHSSGLKPMEGRVEYHDISNDDAILIRETIMHLWDTDYGRSLARRWFIEFSKYSSTDPRYVRFIYG
jgi:hypothetical protein